MPVCLSRMIVISPRWMGRVAEWASTRTGTSSPITECIIVCCRQRPKPYTITTRNKACSLSSALWIVSVLRPICILCKIAPLDRHGFLVGWDLKGVAPCISGVICSVSGVGNRGQCAVDARIAVFQLIFQIMELPVQCRPVVTVVIAVVFQRSPTGIMPLTDPVACSPVARGIWIKTGFLFNICENSTSGGLIQLHGSGQIVVNRFLIASCCHDLIAAGRILIICCGYRKRCRENGHKQHKRDGKGECAAE